MQIKLDALLFVESLPGRAGEETTPPGYPGALGNLKEAQLDILECRSRFRILW